jgi:predicted Zn-ribbon and HTH transcriptional regulator
MRYKLIYFLIFNFTIVTFNYFFQVKAYFNEKNQHDIPKICGISQNPDTKDYIIILKNDYCKKCGEIYTDIYCKWCKLCKISNLKQDFANWTSGNEKIDDFIQKMQLKIKTRDNIIIEWIPYNQFNNIKNIYKDDFSTINLATWRNGLLEFNYYEQRHLRKSNKNVTLKYLNNYQNDINKFLNEV